MRNQATRCPELRVLDLLAIGIVLLDGDGQVSFANTAARNLTAERDGVEINGRVRIDNRADASRLCDIVAALTSGSAKDAASASMPASGFAMRRPLGGRDLLLLASRLPGDTGDAPRIALFLSDPDSNGLDLPKDVIANLFDLTETETRIALALAKGRRKDQIAEHFQISETTVAFHLRNLFQKTHTNRQAELVSLMLCGLQVIQPQQCEA